MMKQSGHDGEIVLSIDDVDLREVLGPAAYDRISGAVGETSTMGSDTDPEILEAVRSALPRAIIRKLQRLFTTDINITKIELKFSAQGMPLGVGFAADVSVTIEP